MLSRIISIQVRGGLVAMIFILMAFMLIRPALAAEPGLILSVNGSTGTVKPGDPCPSPRNGAVYQTIQKAVTCAIAGDTITVAAGNYSENVAVDKAVTLLGANAGIDGRNPRGAETIVDGHAVSAPMGLAANGVIVDGFKFIAGQNGLGAGVWIGGNVTGVQVQNSVFTDNTIGLAIIGACPCTISHNLFSANNRTGAAGGKALYAEKTNGLIFENNTITGHSRDIPIVFGALPPTSVHSNLTFTGNTIYSNTYNGVYMLSVNGANISANNFVGDGLFLKGGNHNINVFTNNFSGGDPAINISLLADGNPYGTNSNILIHFNRFIANAVVIQRVNNYTGTLDAENNWWGCNYGPGVSGAGCAGTTNANSGTGIDANPWLILRIFADRPTVGQGGDMVPIRANFRGNSAGIDTANLGYIPDAVPVSFSATLGTVSPAQAKTSNGLALSKFIAGPALGTASIKSTADSQSVSLSLLITLNYQYLPVLIKE